MSIQQIMRQWKTESGSTRVCQFKLDKEGILNIYTSQPGFYIGKYGALVFKYREILKSKFPSIKNVNFVETDWYWV